MTIAQKYNAKCKELIPCQSQLLVDDSIDSAGKIDDIVFRRRST